MSVDWNKYPPLPPPPAFPEWLIRQAYGFRDVFYLKLKIFQPPSIQPQKAL